ncbi:MAG: glycosyltransferase family 2 protein [Bacteroidetes bacterium]|nr:glycosyltransferase family 2 protein [Bacteroidota bacterium]
MKPKVVVVMPAYNAEATLRTTHEEVLSTGFVDQVVIVDDASNDKTVELAKKLPSSHVIAHETNRGYGGNQKTCYRAALQLGGDIIVMVHPDYQYTPRLIPAMVSMISSGLYDCVIASRILGGGALKGGMPLWRYLPNRFLTLVQNLLMGAKLSEYHTGYRAFSRRLLEHLPIEKNSDDFVFDNQMLAQIIWTGNTIAEITCPTKYFREASSINFRRSIIYGLGCLGVALRFRLAKLGILAPMVEPGGAS